MPILDDLGKGLGKGLDSLKKAGAQAAETVKDTAKTLEIKNEIGKLEGKIKDITFKAGEAALALVAEGKVKDAGLVGFSTEIEEIKTQITEKMKEIESIKNN